MVCTLCGFCRDDKSFFFTDCIVSYVCFQFVKCIRILHFLLWYDVYEAVVSGCACHIATSLCTPSLQPWHPMLNNYIENIVHLSPPILLYVLSTFYCYTEEKLFSLFMYIICSKNVSINIIKKYFATFCVCNGWHISGAIRCRLFQLSHFFFTLLFIFHLYFPSHSVDFRLLGKKIFEILALSMWKIKY